MERAGLHGCEQVLNLTIFAGPLWYLYFELHPYAPHVYMYMHMYDICICHVNIYLYSISNQYVWHNSHCENTHHITIRHSMKSSIIAPPLLPRRFGAFPILWVHLAPLRCEIRCWCVITPPILPWREGNETPPRPFFFWIFGKSWAW